MQIDSINEGHVHHYKYTAKGKTYTGKGEVIEKVKKVNGWRVILEDKARNETLTLYPKWVTK